MKIIVRKHGSTQTLHLQEFNQLEKYLTGFYDIEIPVLPEVFLENIEIKQSAVTRIEIPRPGVVNFFFPAPGYGSIYVKEGNNLRGICNLNKEGKTETLTLLPGSYTAVFRPLNARSSLQTITRYFEVTSGSSAGIELE